METNSNIMEMLNATRFGIEIEVSNCPQEKAETAIQTALRGLVTENEITRWNVVYDSSVYNGCEVVTPPLTYNQLYLVQVVCEELNRAGAVSNAQNGCGLHIHLDASRHTFKSLINLYKTVAKREQLLEKCLKISSRRLEHYCERLSSHPEVFGGLARIKNADDLAKWIYSTTDEHEVEYYKRNKYHNSRYKMLNLHSVFYRGTVEFRFFELHGEVDFQEVKAYVQLALLVNQKALSAKSVTLQDTNHNNWKYRTHCWLNQLKAEGDEFSWLRKFMIGNVPGDVAFKNGRPPRNNKKKGE